jgi:hypothetical protein
MPRLIDAAAFPKAERPGADAPSCVERAARLLLGERCRRAAARCDSQPMNQRRVQLFSSATARSESCAIEVMLRVLQMRLGSESGATLWSLGDAISDTISLDATQRCFTAARWPKMASFNRLFDACASLAAADQL